MAAVQAALGERPALVLLDNCEQVRDAAPALAALLSSCPELRVLATSRAPWHIQGEHVYALDPLALPAPHGVAPDAVATSEAVALFVARAQAMRPDFALTANNAAAIAAICRRLDGLPLAIELAAARLTVLTPRTLLGLLERRLPLLVGGPRDAADRQQTLRATLTWSYELLHPAAQTLFRRLCVFAGGYSLAALQAVCGNGADLADDLLPWVGELVDQSLVRTQEQADGETRLVLLETIREFGLERLEESGEAEMLRRQHAAYYLALAKEAQHQLTGPDQERWLARLEQEHDNLRAALHRASERGETDLGLRIAGALGRFWLMRGHLSEGRQWLDALLRQGTGIDRAARAMAVKWAGILAWRQGDSARAIVFQEESLALHREIGDKRGIAAALSNLGLVAAEQGNYARARMFQEESLALCRELGDKGGIATTLHNLGQGDLMHAAAFYSGIRSDCQSQRPCGRARGGS